MKIRIPLLKIIILLCFTGSLFAQTSWKGTVSTNWKTSTNWTAGVPNSTTDAIIGDANFTGSYQPVLTGSTASCKSLSIGTGSVASTLSIDKNINFYGDVTIGSNGSILHSTSNRTITLKGNWINNGTYSATGTNVIVSFSGTAQTITGVTVFKGLTVNTGSTVTLASNITVNTALTVYGSIDPSTYAIAGTGTLNANNSGALLVKAATFAANYALTGGVTLSATSTVNYASAAISQTISAAYTYGSLRISGGTTKFLTANLLPLNSSTSSCGRIYIDAGIFDLQGFTANRGTSVAGGYFIIAIGSMLKIGGTGTFPANFSYVTIASNSTVDYYGNNQVITKYSYGNLIFESTSGVAVKTMPALSMTIAGDFTCMAGLGSGVTLTAAANLTVNLNVTLGTGTTFNGSTFSHYFKSGWNNNGTFNGNTSTVTFSGLNAVLNGTGTNNFYNLSFTGAGITAAGTTALNVAGNISTSGSGAFSHGTNGTVTLTGAAKVISGNGLSFYNCFISGTLTGSASFFVKGDFTVNGSYAASSSSTITFSGVSKTIAGSGTITFYSLNVLGTISTTANFSLLQNFMVALAGSFTASNGTATFNGTTTLSGTADLFNVTINSGKTLSIGTNANLGIAGAFVKTGTLNVTSNVPNTVTYNGAGAQSVVNTTYHNLILANGGTKTPAGNIFANNDLTINANVTFNASLYTFTLYRHFTNNGTFIAGTSTLQLSGSNAATLTGATTFYNLTENKTSALIAVTLASNITAGTLTMTAGNMQTGLNAVTITTTRSGAGIIIGTIVHAHAFTSGTPYYFEGPQNSITFTSPSAALNAVTVKVIPGAITDFDPSRECLNREYQVSINAGTYTNAAFSFHYEDNELNAFSEPFLSLFKHNVATTWDSLGVTTRNAASNYITLAGITNLPGRYSASGLRNIVRWNGSVSAAWENAANWTTISGSSMVNRVPTPTDAAEIGEGTFTNNPVINSNQQIGLLKFGSVQPATLTINSGSLDNLGSIRGTWSGAAAHTLNVNAGTLSTGTSFVMSDGIAGHSISLVIGTGSATINSTLVQNGGNVTFSGNGSLILLDDYNYTSGNFTGGAGTVIYTGTDAQVVASVPYTNLSFTKPTAMATINSPVVVNGNFTTSGGGEVVANAAITVAGNMTIGAATTLTENGIAINLAGNWTNNGLFAVNNGTVNFNGNGAQTVNATTFNNLIVNKASGALTLTGDLVINSDLSLTAGTLDLSTFTADRSNVGGTVWLSAGTLLKAAGTNNFPQNFIANSIHPASTVEYNGTITQTVAAMDYGNLTFSNGGSTAKTFFDNTTVNGNLLINSGATIDANNSTIALAGNFVNNGTFTPSGILYLTGASNTITGSTTFNSLLISGSYTVVSGTTSIAGDVMINTGAALSFGSNAVSLDGDLTVNGSLTSNGVSTFTGTRVQTLGIVNAIISSSTGVINFNGTVAPVFNSNTSPTFATLNINNTAGITPSVPWTVFVACNISAGAFFNGGALVHTFYGNFTNNGTVTSSGELRFVPAPPYSAAATIKLDGASFVSTGTVTFGGTSPITIQNASPSFQVVSITNTNAAGVAPPNGWIINDELFISNGSTFKGGAGLNHTLNGNLTNNGTFTGQTSTVTFAGASCEINGLGTSDFYNLTIAAAADLTLNRAINIGRNLVVDGAFTATGRTVAFTGATSSVVSGLAGAVTFDNLEQNKTAATTTLSIPATVTNELMMLNGIINTTSTNLLTIANNATSSPGNALSYVDGPMKKIGNDTFTFPLGDGLYWARLSITAPLLSTDAYTAQYFATAYSNTTSMALLPLPWLNNVSTNEYWTCNRNSGISSVKVKLYWQSSARSGISNYSPDLVVARWNGLAWENAGQSAITAGSPGNVTSYTQLLYTVFTFGSVNGNNTLPIELITFNATATNEQQVNLVWSTATETNNDFFTVERTIDGVNFETVAEMDGAGNSTQVLYYSTLDANPLNGVSYYRLKQTDFNGQFSYSSLVAVTLENASPAGGFGLYPNPGNGEQVNVTVDVVKDQELVISILDVTGKICFYEAMRAAQDGSFTYVLHPEQHLVAGLYFVSVSTAGKVASEKLLIK